jgi:hypothetical protein
MKDKCSGCGAKIVWAVTANNKAIPLDAKPEKRFTLVPKGGFNEARVTDTYVTHFATCPKAAEFKTQ